MTKYYLPSFQEGKAIAATTLLLKLSKGICDKYWLNKVMYYLERESLIRMGQPIFNDSLYSIKYGPIASAVNDGIDNTEYPFDSEWNNFITLTGKEVRLITEADYEIFSENEYELIVEAYEKFKGWSFNKMKEYFHSLPEHKETNSRIDIEYLDIFKAAGVDEESIQDSLKTISYFNHFNTVVNCG